MLSLALGLVLFTPQGQAESAIPSQVVQSGGAGAQVAGFQGAQSEAAGSSANATAGVDGLRYRVVALPTLAESEVATGNALAINGLSQVVGASDNWASTRHGYVWSPGTVVIDLDPANPLVASEASGINDFGEIVGYRQDAGFGEFRAALWTPDGGMVDLGAPDGMDSYAVAISNRGEAVGFVGISTTRAFHWDVARGLRYLPSPGVSAAWDISDAGLIVGSSSAAAGSSNLDLAAVWRVDGNTGAISGPEFLGTFDGSNFSEAKAVNGHGRLVGWMRKGIIDVAFFSPPAPTTAEREMIEILGSDEPHSSWALGINDRNEIVGSFRGDALDHAFYWSADLGRVDLNHALENDPGGLWTLVSADAINDEGEIVGYGVYRGRYRPFLLTPVRAGGG